MFSLIINVAKISPGNKKHGIVIAISAGIHAVAPLLEDCTLYQQNLKYIDMDDEKEELEHPESGDNPEERLKKSGGTVKKDMTEDQEADLESGDNPAERERKAGK